MLPSIVLNPAPSPGGGLSGRFVDEIAAAAILEIVERADLAGHFKRVAIDRVVPAFDVDRTGPTGEPEFRDDVDPVAVAEAGGAHEHELLLAEDAVLLDHLPPHRCVLAVHVEEFVRPLADLGQRIDEVNQLVAGLPFEPQIVGGQGIEHQLPGVGIVGDIPVPRRPVAVHGAVLEGDFDALVGRALREFAEDLLEARQARFDRLVADATREAGDAGRAEVVGVVDRVLPGGERRKVGLPLLERVAEHPDGGDRDVAIADGVERTLAQFGKILPVGGLPEERLETFETEIGDLGDALGRARLARLYHGADADGFGGIGQLKALMLKFRRAGAFARCRWRQRPWRDS